MLGHGDASIGYTRGVVTYLAWHAGRDSVSIDLAHGAQHRNFTPNASDDFVDMQYPQLVFADQHRFSKNLQAAIGYARYEATGTWTTTPVYGVNALGFLGAECDFGHGQQLLIQLRRYGLRGMPSIPSGPPPTLRGTMLVVDHHFTL